MTDMNRIEARMNACSKKQEKAFITYITAGLPDLAATKGNHPGAGARRLRRD